MVKASVAHDAHERLDQLRGVLKDLNIKDLKIPVHKDQKTAKSKDSFEKGKLAFEKLFAEHKRKIEIHILKILFKEHKDIDKDVDEDDITQFIKRLSVLGTLLIEIL